MVNFGPLAVEIVSLVWGTLANFNGFRVLAALLHGSQVLHERQTNFAASNRGRHLSSAGRPSRWALAHISSFNVSHLHIAPPFGVTPFEFCRDFRRQKNGISGLSCGVVCVILRLSVSLEHRLVTDEQT